MQASSIPTAFRSALQASTVRFLITGSSAALLFYGLTVALLHAGAPPFGGTLAAYAVAFVASYTVQHAWTFSGRHAHAQSFPRYFAAQIVCALVSGLVSRAGAAGGLPPALLALASTLAASSLSFVLSRYWVFPARR